MASTRTTNIHGPGAWATGSPGFNLRMGLSPVNVIRSASTAVKFGLGTKLGLAATGLGMYSGVSPTQMMWDYSVGAAAFTAGGRIGGAIGSKVASNIYRTAAGGVASFAPRSSFLTAASKYVGKAGVVGTVAGGAIGAFAAIAGSSAMYDAVASAPRKAMEYGRRLKQLETGGGFHDPFGTAYTMRQRSLKEIQRSHLSARNALGNEAFYSHIR